LRRPSHVIVAHPLHPHRHAQRARQQDGLILRPRIAAVRAAKMARPRIGATTLSSPTASIFAMAARRNCGFCEWVWTVTEPSPSHPPATPSAR
jgi:hypothetical protein